MVIDHTEKIIFATILLSPNNTLNILWLYIHVNTLSHVPHHWKSCSQHISYISLYLYFPESIGWERRSLHLQILKRVSAGSDASSSQLCNAPSPCRVVRVTVPFTLVKITTGVSSVACLDYCVEPQVPWEICFSAYSSFLFCFLSF